MKAVSRVPARFLLCTSLLVFPLLLAVSDGYLGVKKGLNVASQYGYDSNFREKRPILGFAGGVYFSWGISDLITLEPEILFSVKGRFEYDELSEYRLSISYFDLPVLFKLRLGGERLGISLYGGPQAAFPLSAAMRIRESRDVPVTRSLNDDLAGPDAGIVVGIEAGLPVGAYILALDMRYNLGFLPALTTGKPRNSTITILLGYGYRMVQKKKPE